MTWYPDEAAVASANVTAAMAELGFDSFDEFYSWSITSRESFWGKVVERLGVAFHTRPTHVMGSDDPLAPQWLAGAVLNIAESCFTSSPGDPALLFRTGGSIRKVTYGELLQDVHRCANGLDALGLVPGDRVAIAMPMTYESVVAYLGIVWIGGVVVSIADSFAAPEIASRLAIADAQLVVTQDHVVRGGRTLPMLEKVAAAGVRQAVVVSTLGGPPLRENDVPWRALLSDPTPRPATHSGPSHRTNILFSSGTTGNPKAIPWTQVTPIKAAMDGHFHQDIHSTDVVAWPTNLGWMMGPWLIYATLINGASMALHDDAPTGADFGAFVQDAEVTVLGVVPSLVSTWKTTGCLDGIDWTRIRLFSTTGEASNASDMSWLMGVAGGKPIIEYCGGTEIGGGYLTSTVLHLSIPSTFSTPALGHEITILDSAGEPADQGELFLYPPAIGFSETLLNRDHHTEYHAGTPSPDGRLLRRHGDEVARFADGTFQVLGRADDTMNLGGIKVGSAELERALIDSPGLTECAAIAVSPPGGGPSTLVVYAVTTIDHTPEEWATTFTARLKSTLNPLFRVSQVILTEALPRTASGKVMRRELRAAAPMSTSTSTSTSTKSRNADSNFNPG